MIAETDELWIAAMFGGITAILKYYEPVVVNKAQKFQDKSRAVLNEHDLQQTCRLAISRAWEKQCSRLNVVNFDMLVKWCMDNALKTEVSKEFTQKRGKCKISMMSEMETDQDGEESTGMAERSIFRDDPDKMRKSPGVEFLIHDLCSALPQENLRKTFLTILEFYPPENLQICNLSTAIRAHMVEKLQIPEMQLVHDLENIQFIFSGLRERYVA